ncbi:hypothetical protein [Amorphus orientalis]|uniref:Uncharacterized protein n=1 Tax=Amorphus orientalis TaxID=649198 RepID=A0AAE4ATI8_9HYPH|nr:hypothetical protein [Amorphus orientalis]MDQ0316197.1 hypothetical protein [Amorphus orientalis]
MSYDATGSDPDSSKRVTDATPTYKKLGLFVGCLLAGVVAIGLLLVWLVPSTPTSARHFGHVTGSRLMESKIAWYREQTRTRQFDVIVVGNSMCEFGIDGDVVTQAMDGAPFNPSGTPASKVFNASIGGLSPKVADQYVRVLFSIQKPKSLIYCASLIGRALRDGDDENAIWNAAMDEERIDYFFDAYEGSIFQKLSFSPYLSNLSLVVFDSHAYRKIFAFFADLFRTNADRLGAGYQDTVPLGSDGGYELPSTAVAQPEFREANYSVLTGPSWTAIEALQGLTDSIGVDFYVMPIFISGMMTADTDVADIPLARLEAIGVRTIDCAIRMSAKAVDLADDTHLSWLGEQRLSKCVGDALRTGQLHDLPIIDNASDYLSEADMPVSDRRAPAFDDILPRAASFPNYFLTTVRPSSSPDAVLEIKLSDSWQTAPLPVAAFDFSARVLTASGEDTEAEILDLSPYSFTIAVPDRWTPGTVAMVRLGVFKEGDFVPVNTPVKSYSWR